MRRTSLCIIIGILAMSPGVLSQTQPSTNPPALSFDERRHNSIIAPIDAAGGRRPMTNLKMAMGEAIAAVKQATIQSLQQPKVIASTYYPIYSEKNKIGIWVTWLEDSPSLKIIIVRNPETNREVRIVIPPQELDTRRKDNAPYGFIYYWYTTVPSDLVDGTAQVLQIRALDQPVPANCYPAVPTDNNQAAPSSQP
jgi:hypothetical protein